MDLGNFENDIFWICLNTNLNKVIYNNLIFF
jgi:hypothetical protein